MSWDKRGPGARWRDTAQDALMRESEEQWREQNRWFRIPYTAMPPRSKPKGSAKEEGTPWYFAHCGAWHWNGV
eukprot:10169484-Alexandrium_andersonii.AAC.1